MPCPNITLTMGIHKICYHLTRMMGENKMWVNDVIREKGINRNSAPLIYKEIAQKVDLEALRRLCRLFKCEASDMLEFTDEQR